MRHLLLAATALAIAAPVAAQDRGLNRSQVMTTAEHLDDVIGLRLTNSPAIRIEQ